MENIGVNDPSSVLILSVHFLFLTLYLPSLAVYVLLVLTYSVL
jgi:hypothetical protein